MQITFASLIALVGLVSGLWSLATGKAFVSWPIDEIRRDENPKEFWITTGGYLVIGGVGLVVWLIQAAGS